MADRRQLQNEIDRINERVRERLRELLEHEGISDDLKAQLVEFVSGKFRRGLSAD